MESPEGLNNGWAFLSFVVLQILTYLKARHDNNKTKEAAEEELEKVRKAREVTAQERDKMLALHDLRITSLESNQAGIVKSVEKLSETVHKIAEDTSYIKGRFTRVMI